MSSARTFVIDPSRGAASEFSEQFEEWAMQHDVPDRTIRAFQVVFDEMLTNAIDYGLEGKPDALLQVTVSYYPDRLTALIVDNGLAFDPLVEAEAPDTEASLEDRPIGGLGIHLVKSLMDSASYERSEDCNLLSLSKHFEE
ncbi:MAG: ATP-binding protein [Xanthomonadales bacterium]|nr:ATP-binding protein [Xanthomonadales bacterium]